jgi:hypothetical protein
MERKAIGSTPGFKARATMTTWRRDSARARRFLVEIRETDTMRPFDWTSDGKLPSATADIGLAVGARAEMNCRSRPIGARHAG